MNNNDLYNVSLLDNDSETQTYSHNGPHVKYDTDCIMCMESANPCNKITHDIAHLACGHVYHYKCLMEWQQTIHNYLINNIECCICKQHVCLTGIWDPTGNYTRINPRIIGNSIYDNTRMHNKPPLNVDNISLIIQNHSQYLQHQQQWQQQQYQQQQQQQPPRQHQQRRRLISYIPGFGCCTSQQS